MKTIRDFDLNNKRVIIRVDFNVPIENGVIMDDNRIVESLITINYAINHHAKVILLSHLGRIKEEGDKVKYTLKPVAKRLSELLNRSVSFIPATRGPLVDNAVNSMNSGDIILLENTRYEDLNGKLESGNDEDLGRYWASLGDIMINDAFGTSHRTHASNVGIMTYLPCGIGFLVEKECENILPVINNPEHPFVLILGGAKVSDKIRVIDNLINKCDYILIGGGMAYTFLKAQGKEIGKSLLDSDSLDYCKNLLNKTDKIILPIDHVCSNGIDGNSVLVDNIPNNLTAFDIGPKTISLFTKYLQNSKTIIWNGPVGYFEKKPYDEGTKGLCKIISSLNNTKIVGGGDTARSVIEFGYKDKFTHVSTGGGASLHLLSGLELPFMNLIRR